MKRKIFLFRKLAQRFQVAKSFVQKILKQYRKTGDLSPKAQGGSPPRKLQGDQLMTTTGEVESGIKIIDDLVYQHQGSHLTKIEMSIIGGSLNNLTYQQIKDLEGIKLQYTVEYISRNLAYNLWNKLTKIVQESDLIETKIKVKKKNIWDLVEIINQSQVNDNQSTIIPITSHMEGKTLLNRYEIEEHLFDRDSGERHFRARDIRLFSQPCLIIQRCHQTPRIRQQFEQEAGVLSRISRHPQVPVLLTYFAESRHLYLIYEQISGTPLTELLGTETWQESKVKSLLRDLLTVLEFIQQSNVIHRNLNPDNIIQSDHKWVLTDFATVKEIDRDNNSLSYSTFAQGMKGYMPAEQHTGITQFSSDIYALGMIAVRALTGIHPHNLKCDSQTGNKIWRDQVEVSDRFADLIDRAICYHFRDRYQSAQEMLTTLNNIAVV